MCFRQSIICAHCEFLWLAVILHTKVVMKKRYSKSPRAKQLNQVIERLSREKEEEEKSTFTQDKHVFLFPVPGRSLLTRNRKEKDRKKGPSSDDKTRTTLQT